MLLVFYSGSQHGFLIFLSGCSLVVLCASTLLYFASRDNVDKREALENLDLILLCIDEIVDGG